MEETGRYAADDFNFAINEVAKSAGDQRSFKELISLKVLEMALNIPSFQPTSKTIEILIQDEPLALLLAKARPSRLLFEKVLEHACCHDQDSVMENVLATGFIPSFSIWIYSAVYRNYDIARSSLLHTHPNRFQSIAKNILKTGLGTVPPRVLCLMMKNGLRFDLLDQSSVSQFHCALSILTRTIITRENLQFYLDDPLLAKLRNCNEGSVEHLIYSRLVSYIEAILMLHDLEKELPYPEEAIKMFLDCFTSGSLQENPYIGDRLPVDKVDKELTRHYKDVSVKSNPVPRLMFLTRLAVVKHLSKDLREHRKQIEVLTRFIPPNLCRYLSFDEE